MAPVLRVVAAVAVAALLLLLPLAQLAVAALSEGLHVATVALRDPEAIASIRLTLLVAAISVPVNGLCGFAAAWCLAKFDFPGRDVIALLIALPFSVSPVVSGLAWMLLFGAQGWFAHGLAAAHLRVAFALPGIVLATLFVTFPFVTRTLLPLMQEQGRGGEEAAATLGAGLWSTLLRVTLPNVRWALLSAVLLTNARAMGEFGAVSIVSGRIPGLTETMPLHIDTLYEGSQPAAAFAMAGLLALLGLATVVAKALLERLS